MNDLTVFIEHTRLGPETEPDDIDCLCKEAVEWGFPWVCVPPTWVAHATDILAGRAEVVTVVGFPHGNEATEVKVAATRKAILDGATEIDMVLNLGLLRARQYPEVENDVRAVVEAASGHIVKVIVEASCLTRTELRRVCEKVVSAGAHFVMTSTGFGSRTRVEDVRYLATCLGSSGVKIKAAGGIKMRVQAQALRIAGATRLGCSRSIQIVSEHPTSIPPVAATEPKTAEHQRDYAWKWFEYHASQRISMFHHFLVTFGALAAACGWVWKEEPLAAAIVAGIGAFIAVCFVQLDRRNSHIVKRGERVLQILESDHLFVEEAQRQGFEGLLLKEDGSLAKSGLTYGKLIPAIQYLAAVLFLVLACFAYQSLEPDIDITIRLQRGEPRVLEVFVQNNTRRPMRRFQVDVELPTQLLASSNTAPIVGDWSTGGDSLLRLADTAVPELLPGERKSVLRIPVVESKFASGKARVVVYGPGLRSTELDIQLSHLLPPRN